MTKAKSLSTKALKKDLLSLLESNLESLEENLQNGNGEPDANGKRRVHFNQLVHQRAFRKDKPAADFEAEDQTEAEFYEQQAQMRQDDDDDSAEDENSEDSDGDQEDDEFDIAQYDEDDDEDEEDEDSEEEDLSGDEALDGDFASLSPAEQLRLLMAPVEDDPTLADDMDEDDAPIDFDQDDEEHDDDEQGYDDDDREEDFEDEGEDEQERDDNIEELSAKPPKKKLRLALDEDEEDEFSAVKSSFEKQQERLQRTIAEFEEENVGEKPWMLQGEVSAKIRPQNSLLEEDIDFEHASKAAPVITEEVTESLEQLIKQRVKERAWDDVKRKTLAEVQSATARKRKLPELDDEKSKKSLSQVYEDEKMAAVSKPTQSSSSDAPVDEATKKIHDELTELFSKVCKKLDGLSQFKFAPRSYPLADINVKSVKFVRKAVANRPAPK